MYFEYNTSIFPLSMTRHSLLIKLSTIELRLFQNSSNPVSIYIYKVVTCVSKSTFLILVYSENLKKGFELCF